VKGLTYSCKVQCCRKTNGHRTLRDLVPTSLWRLAVRCLVRDFCRHLATTFGAPSTIAGNCVEVATATRHSYSVHAVARRSLICYNQINHAHERNYHCRRRSISLTNEDLRLAAYAPLIPSRSVCGIGSRDGDFTHETDGVTPQRFLRRPYVSSVLVWCSKSFSDGHKFLE